MALIWFILLPVAGSALSPRTASYRIAVTLDPSEHRLDARQTLRWTNRSTDTVRTLQFHLYLNAFRNERSTFMQGRSVREPGEEGWIDLTAVRTGDGEDLTDRLVFIRPDDGNEHDSTVVELALERPVLPGDSIALRMEFRARLPRVIARTGHAGDFHMVAQWFPKIGVWEGAGTRGRARGGWVCHQFHRRTEFFADFGVYDVEIAVPDRFVVGATGVLVSESRDSLARFRYRAEDVHDFAWAASPDFVPVTARWRRVDLRILMQPQRAGQARRYREAAVAALRYLDEHVGEYPYPSLTIVDPAFGASAAGGMEYPMLVTAGTVWGTPDGFRYPEEVTVHEIVHQYWYGMVASNEVEEAWIDEGLTTYYTGRIMDRTYGPSTSMVDLPLLRVGRTELSRTGYTRMRDPRLAPIDTTTWHVGDRAFGQIVYYKTATVFATLERMLGRPAMDQVMREFFRRWRFAHPSGEDLVAVFNELAPRLRPDRFGEGLDWFFGQVLSGTVTCDFELSEIASSRIGDGAGDTLTVSAVTVRQLGQARLPAAVRVRFADGAEVLEEWDGRSSSVILRYARPSPVIEAEVDPHRTVLLDLNVVNNSRTVDPDPVPVWSFATRIGLVLQALMQLAALGA